MNIRTAMTRRELLRDAGLGFGGLALTAMLASESRAPCPWDNRSPQHVGLLSTQSQECHLAIHDWRCQPHGIVRSETCSQSLRRQDLHRNTVWGRPQIALPGQRTRGRVRPKQWFCSNRGLSIAGWLSPMGLKWPRDQPLVSSFGAMRRRPVPHPVDVDRG